MVNMHVRSNNFPSKSHPTVNNVKDRLCKLKSLEATSVLAPSVCANLASLRDLNEAIKNMMQLPSIQQALSCEKRGKWDIELIDETLGLVDLCGFARKLCLVKESVHELESSIKRNRAETATTEGINHYMVSRKKINKMVYNYFKKSKIFKQSSAALLAKGDDFKAIATNLKEMEAFGFSVLGSVLILVSGEKGRCKKRNWSFLPKFNQTNCLHSQSKQQKEEAEDLCHVGINKSMEKCGHYCWAECLESVDIIGTENTGNQSGVTRFI